MIKDLGVGYGVFVRQEEATILKDNMLINVGEAYIVVNLYKGQSEDQPHTYAPDQDSNVNLKLKIFGGPSAGEVYFFKNEA